MINIYRSILSLLLFISFTVHAEEHFFIVKDCFLSKRTTFTEIARAKKLVLIKSTNITQLQKASEQNHLHCRGFLDVTRKWQVYNKNQSASATTFTADFLVKAHARNELKAYQIQHQEVVFPLFDLLDQKRMTSDLSYLTTLPDRAVDSESGAQAATWIKEQVMELVEQTKSKNIALIELPTLGMKQPSILVKVAGNVTAPAIVLGAHLDTLAKTYENRPGADDNASGVSVLLESLRVLLSSHIKLQKPVYFIWYAGSEQGKLGAQNAAEYFKKKNINVSAVLQIDQAGMLDKSGAGIGLTDDYADISLTAFIADLVATYVKLPVSAVHCGFACSDHVVWYQNNIPVVYPFETMNDTNPFAATRHDKMNKISLSHMADFVKLSLAFAVELAAAN